MKREEEPLVARANGSVEFLSCFNCCAAPMLQLPTFAVCALDDRALCLRDPSC